MSSEQVLGQEELARATLEAAQVDASSLEGHATLAEPADLSNGDKEISPFDPDDRSHDGRMRVVTEARDQILDASDPVAVLIEDWTAQER
jgi:hypothetical protein